MILISILIIYFSSIYTMNVCEDAQSCDLCILRDSDCRWCLDEEIYHQAQCFNVTSSDIICDRFDKMEPNIEASIYSRELNHIYPSTINITLMPGKSVQFNMTLEVEYPHIDLYILIDYTRSMSEHVDLIRNITMSVVDYVKSNNNSKIGLGLYGDKPIEPFSYECESLSCLPTFTYKNEISLTSDYDLILKYIANFEIPSNADSHTSFLDALHQTVSCPEHIGWRSHRKYKKIVVVITSSSTRSAGDGRVAAIFKPHDGKCHLNESNYYNKDHELDYVSVSKLEQILQQNSVSLLISLLSDDMHEYKNLISNLKDVVSTVISINETNPSIIDELDFLFKKIKEQRSLKFKVNRFLSIHYDLSISSVDKNNTQNVEKTIQYNYIISVTANECPEGEPYFHEMKFEMDEMEPSVLRYKIKCRCECNLNENNEKYETCNMSKVLNCNDIWGGETCDCGNKPIKSLQGCITPGSDKICNERGTCYNGKCNCLNNEFTATKYYGIYCKCSDSLCPKYKGLICGGSTRGLCTCNKCNCHDQFSGEKCETRNCSAPYWKLHCERNGTICGNAGICECGECKCNMSYEGVWCEQKNIQSSTCSEYNQCLECQIKNQECNSFCMDYTVENINNSGINSLQENTFPCLYDYSSACQLPFKILQNSTHKIIKYKHIECEIKGNIFSLPIVLFIGIIIFGLIILTFMFIVKKTYELRSLRKFKNKNRTSGMITPYSLNTKKNSYQLINAKDI